MDRGEWQEYQDYLTIAHAWSKIIFRAKRGKDWDRYDQRFIAYNAAKTAVSRMREVIRAQLIHPTVSHNNLLKREILYKARNAFTAPASRTRISVNIGYANGTRIGRGAVVVHVGWLWNRTVYRPLYAEGFENRDWIILKAEEMKVNSKHVRLFECIGYSQRLNENKTVYIAEKKTGDRFFVLAHTVRSAIDNIENELAREVHTTIIGENDDKIEHG